MVELDFKITKTICEFDLYELHNWAFYKFEYVSDEFSFEEYRLLQFFPQAHHFLEFVS